MLKPPKPLAADLGGRWMIRPGITFLNHGSFGALPRAVFDKQNTRRQAIEAEPIEYLGRRNDALVAEIKKPIGSFLRMDPKDFGLLTNATEGINAYLQSLDLNPGDELLTTDHVYNAVRQAMRHTAARQRAEYREFEVPTPVAHPQQVVEAVGRALGPRTRLLCIDHIVSPSALIFPVAEVVALCAGRGVDVLVDGAHAPGMLDLDVPAIGAAAYAGNLHKWCCAPKGSAFLWVRPDHQQRVHPTIISHLRGEGFSREFDWQGTRDLSAWLTIPDALAFMGELGWPAVREHNHALAVWAQAVLAERWGTEPYGPADGSMIGSMAALPLPGKLATLSQAESLALQQSLYDDDRIEAPVMYWRGRHHLRVSCQVYNLPDDYLRVADAIARRVA